MNYLTLENITKHYGEKTLFEGITLHIEKGDKVALVAKNGSGKSTLLKVLMGEETSESDNAKVYLHKDARMGLLSQEPRFNESDTVMEAVFDSENPTIQAIRQYEKALLFPESADALNDAMARMEQLQAWDYEARIKEILTKFNIVDFDQPIATLSGGQRKRVALAKVLIQEPDFLVLDEPTNHLDLDMIEWLEEYLQQPNLTIFLITHDRYFLDRVCNAILELDSGKLYKFKGNYSLYLEKKAIRDEIEGTTLDKSRKLLARELEWVRRSPSARGTKAKARVDAYYDLKEKTTVRGGDDAMQIQFKSERLGKKILEAHNVSKRFGDVAIVERFDYKFKKRDRVGVVGPNGVGKSTFINILTQTIPPDGGKVVVGDTIVFGIYSQEGMSLKNDKRVIDVLTDIAEAIPLSNGRNLSAAQLLERFLFDRKQQQVYVSQLSGGEKRRLYLLTVLMNNPNFLILDEPTNDLDILTLNVLEEFLDEYEGCLLVVTHDRFFMDKLVEHLFVFEGNGLVRDFNGTYSEYREEVKQREAERQREARTLAEAKKAVPAQSAAQSLTQEQKKELRRLEKEITKLEGRKKELTAAFNDAALSHGEIVRLSKELADIQAALEEKEMHWLELSDLE
jgi:ATP-binding cassette subfamily F protein uup